MVSQQELTYNSLIAMHVTKVHQNPEPADIDLLEEQLCVVTTLCNTPHFKGGLKFGHLVVIHSEVKYRHVIVDKEWVYNEPTNPSAYNITNLVNSANALTQMQRSQLEQEFKQNL